MKGSRRDFLRMAGLSAFALGAASVASAVGTPAASAQPAATPEPGAAGNFMTNPSEPQAKRWAMVIDTRKFTTPEQIRRVTDACRHAHNVPVIPGKQEVKWIWADSYHHVFTDDTNAFLPERLINGQFLLMCNHCTNPPCVRVCPTQATFKAENGMVVMDPHRCIGCRFCMAGCPYGARSFNFRDPQDYVEQVNPDYPMRKRGVVEKCTFCPERLAAGKLPACVEASDGAMIFGDLNDPHSPVRKALAENFTVRRKPSLGTEPGVYYII